MKSNFEMCEAARGSGVRSDKYWVSKVVAGSGITQKYHSDRVCSFFYQIACSWSCLPDQCIYLLNGMRIAQQHIKYCTEPDLYNNGMTGFQDHCHKFSRNADASKNKA